MSTKPVFYKILYFSHFDPPSIKMVSPSSKCSALWYSALVWSRPVPQQWSFLLVDSICCWEVWWPLTVSTVWAILLSARFCCRLIEGYRSCLFLHPGQALPFVNSCRLPLLQRVHCWISRCYLLEERLRSLGLLRHYGYKGLHSTRSTLPVCPSLPWDSFHIFVVVRPPRFVKVRSFTSW